MSINDIQAIRKVLFTPCQSKEQLDKWLKYFLDVHLPDCVVHEDSNSSPLDFLYECYSKALTNDLRDFSRVMAYASRSGSKTLSAAVFEVLGLLHLERNVIHMASILEQSEKSLEYIKGFLGKKYIRDFNAGDNKKSTTIVWYKNEKTGEILTEKEFTKLDAPVTVKAQYLKHSQYIKAIAATVRATNGQHSGIFTCVSGNTGIMVKNSGGVRVNRKRKSLTARGIFKMLKGENPTGRHGGESIEIVEEPVNLIEVLSYNFNTASFEFKPIVAAFRRKSKLIRITLKNGKKIACTPDHPLYVVGRGFIPSSEISTYDNICIIGKSPSKTPPIYVEPPSFPLDYKESDLDVWEQVLLGSILGDGAIYRRGTSNPYFQENHGLDQADYLNWKRSILSQKMQLRSTRPISGYTGEFIVGISSGNTKNLLPYVDFRNTLSGVEKLGALGLAVWYMDDGSVGNGVHFNTQCFTLDQHKKLQRVLKNNFDIDVSISTEKKADGRTFFVLRGNTRAKKRLSEICAPYIHRDLAYKFDCSDNFGTCKFCGVNFWRDSSRQICYAPVCRAIQNKSIQSVQVKTIETIKEDWVYDFTVEGNSNFVSDGFISKNCDEIDIVQDPKAYEEAKNIPMSEGNKLPITLLISTRKYSYGYVQKEINEASDTGLEVRHWNIIDVTAACPAELHKPELPKVDMYISSSELQAASVTDYELFDDKRKELFQKYNVFSGCQTCRLLPACKTRLATHQKSQSKYLRNIYEVINIFRQNTKEMAQTQLLCEAPNESGLIFPKFNRETHVKSASEIWELVTGEAPRKTPTKADLIALFKQMDFEFVSGMDFGYTHSFAVVSFATDGYRAFVFDAIVRQGLDMDETIEVTERVKLWDPVIFADKAYPKDIKTFKRRGFHMKDWEKGPGSVEFGISIVRMKLKPAIGGPEMFFLGDDPELEGVIKDMAQFHYATDPNHNITDKPDEKGKDTMDALRYGFMNYFAPGGNLKISKRSDRTEALEVKNPEVVTQSDLEKAQHDFNQRLLQQKISERTGGSQPSTGDGKIKKRGFIWDY